MAKSSTTFSSDKQPRKPRGKSERTKILMAMERVGKSEEGFYDLLVERAHNPEDSFAFTELLKRFSPIPKSVSPTVKFEYPENAKPHEQANFVLRAVATGQIPSDIGQMFISSIKSMIDIEEYTDLKERIERIEAMLNGDSST